MAIFNIENKTDHTHARAFLDKNGRAALQRYDVLKYKQFDKLTDKQLGFFWRPEEIDVSKDSNDFKNLTVHEQHIFTSNLKRQILLDSVQGRAPAEAFGPLISIPELEAWTTAWTFSETIHSRSYTHIIRNVYANPSIVFDEMLEVKEIIDCASDITECYEELHKASLYYQLLGEGTHTVNRKRVEVDLYELKKLLYKTLMSVNILEGVRFYVSFACSWAFAELKKMEGNAKIIKLIARDENLHLAFTQSLLKILPKDDPDYISIAKETEEECIQMFVDAVEQEKEWASYLFKDGSMIGLNAELLHQYIEWICCKRMLAINLKCPFAVPQSNPLPWTQKWIAGGDVQVAPQETEITSYITGGVKQDVSTSSFGGMTL